MHRFVVGLIASAAGIAPAFAQEAAPEPEPAPQTEPQREDDWRPVLDAALAGGDKAETDAVVKTLQAAYPEDAAAIAAAVPVPPPPPEYGFFDLEGWDGEVELSYNQANGNSENNAFGGLANATNEIGRYLHTFNAYLDIGGADGERTQERFGGFYKIDITISDRVYAYNKLEYEDDRFSGFAYRVFYGAGAGYFVYDNDRTVWQLEAGPGVRYSSIQQTPDTDPTSPTFGQQIPLEDSSTDFAAYASSDFTMQLSEAVNVLNDSDVTYTDTTTTLTTRLAIDTKLNGRLRLRTSARVRFETDPPEGREDTDTVVRASLLFTF
ncbi:MAG: DUF481 domain-containing protein [Pseudomonadota bacterium]